MDFENEFETLTGFTPMKWQSRLYAEYFASGKIPASVDIPTGLGKTSVMAIWYLARKADAKLPRRLVYVVDRRAVVDQATTVANEIKEKSGDEALRISTLRGQYADNREWLEDPAKPAIVIGTVDMVGSRILFSGYGVSRKMRPYHAGLLGVDTLVVLDESHLVPPFERLLETIENGVGSLGPRNDAGRSLVPPFRLLSLSATGRQRGGEIFRLDEARGDFDDAIVKERLDAKKHLIVKPIDAGLAEVAANSDNEVTETEIATGEPTATDNGSEETDNNGHAESKNRKGRKLEEALAERAWALSGDGREPVRILVYCNSRDVAEKTKQEIEGKAKGNKKTGLPKTDIEVELLVGARRVKERVDAATRLKTLGFLADSDIKLDRPAFLIATSAGEVGVDLDADHMVCDLVEWERMVQRFGRVNRKGKGNARIVLLVENKLASSNKGQDDTRKQESCRAPLGCLPKSESGIDVSPGALRTLKLRTETDQELQKIIEAATTSPPLYPALTRALVDAWAMTSLEKHTGRPEVAPWLRGWIDNDALQTAVVWRKYLPVRTKGAQASDKETEDFFEAAPPHLSEKLETETWRVLNWLTARADAVSKAEQIEPDHIVAFAFDHDGSLRKTFQLCDLVQDDDKDREKKRRKELENTLEGATLIVDARLGGLSAGLLVPEADGESVRTADDEEKWPADVRFHIRTTSDEATFDISIRISHVFATKQSDEGEDFERILIATDTTEDSRSASSHPQLLEEHQSWAEQCARHIATAAGLKGGHVEVVAIAARLHDEGKKAARWQRAFNAPFDAKNEIYYAKTKGPLIQARLAGYRHEFGSLPYAEEHDALKKLPRDLQELVLHLIAAHHGYARPVIGTNGCDDAPPSVLEARARDIALRFARLQKRWGPWGLAWWEALLRAADQQASRENDKQGNKNGGS